METTAHPPAPDFALPAPRQRPHEVARDTFVIRAVMPSVAGTFTNQNSMLIRAAEPVVVDTGMVTNRDIWFEDLFSLVAPDDVRWIFVTHIDTDHAGNLVEALARCPGAVMVTSQGESYRASASLGIPLERMRMVGAGEQFHVGDRVLRASRPPVYDSPYTRALHDPSTGVYYAADAFCAPMPLGVVDWSDEIDPALCEQLRVIDVLGPSSQPPWAIGTLRRVHTSHRSPSSSAMSTSARTRSSSRSVRSVPTYGSESEW